jgi:hypothetical protein
MLTIFDAEQCWVVVLPTLAGCQQQQQAADARASRSLLS